MLVIQCLTSLEQGLTVLIDYEKYMQLNNMRHSRQFLNGSSVLSDSEHSGPPSHGHPAPKHPECHDPHNEVFQDCGSKCVLGCRFASVSSGSLTVGKNECSKNDCVEGCFCKTGLVRHQTKCIPALECPIRKCNHRDEVYVSKK